MCCSASPGAPRGSRFRRRTSFAVKDALVYLEDVAAYGRRGHGGLEFMRGHGLVAAAFRHRTSRAGDPQLHTHVLIANLVKGEDGRWTAMDGRRIYTHAKTAGYTRRRSLPLVAQSDPEVVVSGALRE